MPTTRVIDRLRNWWRAYDPAVWDRWLAVGCAGLAFVPALSSLSAQFGDLPTRRAGAFAVVLVLAQTLPIAVRTRWPAACLAVVGVSFAVHQSLGYPPHFGTVTLYLALYSAGAHQERFRHGLAITASAAYGVFSAVLHLLGSPARPVDFLTYYVVLAGCWVLGAFVRRRRIDERERQRLATAAAATAERARIARELHDVVTHHVTAMVVQADATQFLTGSPDRVAGALTTIGDSGRRALTELRHLLGVLEATGEAAAPPERVADLVEQIRRGGQPVELVEDGDPLPAGVELAVYRVVQEGLTNAVKYAPGQPTAVRIGRRDGQVEVEVTNPLPEVAAARSLSGGRGLNGLRERVGVLGGELSAGEQPDGRYRLRAAIPVGRDV
ncbi:sensor histidine kinase [Amycolatopsis sacchari]|uniref:histidine kinase n=1 Tax=Amycolatopsis sacchari TaxID=115433 RepID=A0A1I3RC89_9PSEU|nr:histidine kinase [Amycolatopsis sacchari]SFJ42981.1 Histidine kinase [Amycolatopsis sacchari]